MATRWFVRPVRGPALLVLVVLLLLVASASRVATPLRAAGRSCQLAPGAPTGAAQFTATVRAGPDAAFTVQGTLLAQVDAVGCLSGTLQQPTPAPTVPVSGHVDGRSLWLQFTLASGRTITGHGVLPASCDRCTLSGTLHGPRPPDRGDWALASSGGGGMSLGALLAMIGGILTH
jgi:hypothetical protein